MEPIEATTPRVRIELDVETRVQLATQQGGRALVHRVRLVNESDTEARGLTLRLRVDPAVADEVAVDIAPIGPRKTVVLEGAALQMPLLVDRLIELSERARGTVRASLAGPVVATDVVANVEVLPWDDWPGVAAPPDLLAAFVTPNRAGVAALMQLAREDLSARGLDPSLEGYQRKQRERVVDIAEAVFRTLGAAGVTYASPPAGFERAGQRVRTVERVLEERVGTCLDVSLALAAVLEQIGLGALIVIVDGHAFPGVWLDDTTFPVSWTDEPTLLRNRVRLGEVLVFDSSAAVQGVPFTQAVDAANVHVHTSPFVSLVDIRAARNAGVRPLPLSRGVAPLAPEPSEALTRRPADAGSVSLPARPVLPTTFVDHTRLGGWRDRLLDLSLNNRLLNQRTRKSRLAAVGNNAAAVLRALADRGSLELRWRTTTDPEALAKAALDGLGGGTLLIDATEKELFEAATECFRTARTFEADTGSSPLFLTLGTLVWVERAGSTVKREAPVLLAPVELRRDTVRGPFRIALKDEGPTTNDTLLKKLATDFAVSAPIVGGAEADGGLDVAAALQGMRHAVRDLPGFEVLDSAGVDLFSFTKYLLWADLEENLDALTANPIVQRLVDDNAPAVPQPAPFAEPAQLDQTRAPADDLSVVDGDATQLAAVWSAVDGNSFVIEGPPGTGKSQTITNMIAQLLARGKTVLFVAEKRAALDVVHARLANVGLDAFVLEAHSEKSTRAAIVAQLEAPLTVARQHPGDGWAQHAAELGAVRTTLNEHAARLNTPGPWGESLQQIIGRLAQLADAPGLGVDAAFVFTREGIGAARASSRALAEAVDLVGDVAAHPWRACDPPVWTPGLQRDVEASLRDGVAAEASALSACAEAASVLPAPLTLDGLRGAGGPDALVLAAVAELGDLVEHARPLTETLLGGRLDAVEGEHARIEAARAELAAVEAQLAPAFALEISTAPALDVWRAKLSRWANSWAVLRWFALFLTLRALRPFAKAALPAPPDVSTQLDRAARRRELVAEIGAGEARLATMAGRATADDARADLAWLTSVRRVARVLASATGPVDALSLGARLQPALAAPLRGAVDAVNRCREARERVSALLRPRDGLWLRAALGAPADTWRGLLQVGSLLRDWAAFRDAVRRTHDTGCGPLAQAVAAGDVRATAIAPAFERSFRAAWLDRAMDNDPALASFRGSSHATMVDRFRTLDEQAKSLARREVLARLAARVPDPTAPGQVAVLQREVRKKRGHLPVRRLFREVREVLARLKPCVLMSPLTVARHLDPSLPPFDVVIFDEASQIPPWDAVGALARGRQAIVVGDSKQLPPTSFFARETGGDDVEDEGLVDLESILDHSRAQGLPALMLGWHYRSRHQSLIAFSNHHYYNNRLYLFPSPARRSTRVGIRWEHVAGGVYDRGGARTNLKEAEAVVAEIVRLVCDPDERRSVGVVTFSQAQQVCVEDLLDRARRDNPALDAALTRDVHEPLFIKNLENVQGDERDVMLFSIGYGPDAGGRTAMAFGPLNRDGGERRLNVAVTRARELMVVYSTLRPEHIDLSRTSARGVHDLKAFLEYAAMGEEALARHAAVDDDAGAESPLEEQIGQAIVAAGWAIVPQVGVAGYRIDIGVVDRQNPGRFILAVECDGAMYHSGATARDRDRLRQAVLERLGWRVARVWSTDWWFDRRATEAALLAAIRSAQDAADASDAAVAAPAGARLPMPGSDAAAAAPSPASPVPPGTRHEERAEDGAVAADAVASPVLSPARFPDTAQPWRPPPALLAGPERSQELFYAVAAQRALDADIRTTVDACGRLHAAALVRHITRAWGFAATSARAAEHVMRRAASVAGVVVDGDAVARHDAPSGPGHFCPPADGLDAELRPLDEVPLVELAGAAAWVTQRAVALGRDDLAREVAAIFGISRMGRTVRERLDAAVAEAIARGWIRDAGGDDVGAV